MKPLNYNHLHYFYVVAREGTITEACKHLNLTPQTVSSQISTLEDQLGLALFERRGKRLILSDNGKKVYSYAQDIFRLGDELVQSVEPNTIHKRMTFDVGITDIIPKILSFEILKPVMDFALDMKLNCHEGRLEQLVAEMAMNKLDLIIADQPIPNNMNLKAYSHKVVSSGLSFFIVGSQAHTITKPFPDCLNELMLLLPGEQSRLKHSLLSWLQKHKLRANINAEFDDSALCELFGQDGHGVFTAPSNIERYILNNYDVVVIGRTNEIQEHIYMISTERKIKHPAAMAILESNELTDLNSIKLP